jgi:sterol desaturase/sphingolipid hydroxylase (fatty acid hydroxylase superfamily)
VIRVRRGGDRQSHKLPTWLSAALVGGTFVTLIRLETRRPLRGKQVESKVRRAARNLAVAATSAAAIQIADRPLTDPLARLVQRRRWGVVKLLRLPRWLEVPLALLLLDYTLYLWHVAFHKVPLLWRFHKVHHVDLDMDASTAVRFHFGEMIFSVFLRAWQIVLIGVSPLTMSIWNTWLLCEVMFHHSNVELPYRVERWLSKLIVTPRMHGVHHSVVPEERNSNWSSGLTLWDWLHGTLRLNVPQDDITIGVAGYRDPRQVTLPKLIEMPFRDEVRDERRLLAGSADRSGSTARR